MPTTKLLTHTSQLHHESKINVVIFRFLSPSLLLAAYVFRVGHNIQVQWNDYLYRRITCVYLVMSSVGPEKLVPGRKMPAATSLVVSTPNLSATMVTSAFGNWFCSSRAVVRPTTPDPITAKCISVVALQLFCSALFSFEMLSHRRHFHFCCCSRFCAVVWCSL